MKTIEPTPSAAGEGVVGIRAGPSVHGLLQRPGDGPGSPSTVAAPVAGQSRFSGCANPVGAVSQPVEPTGEFSFDGVAAVRLPCHRSLPCPLPGAARESDAGGTGMRVGRCGCGTARRCTGWSAGGSARSRSSRSRCPGRRRRRRWRPPRRSSRRPRGRHGLVVRDRDGAGAADRGAASPGSPGGWPRPGGLYSLTAKGLSPGAAFACAVGLLVGYGLLAAAALAGRDDLPRRAARTARRLRRAGVLRSRRSSWSAALVGALALRGVRLSARVVLLVESVSIALMLVVFTLLLVDAARPRRRPAPSRTPGWAGSPPGCCPRWPRSSASRWPPRSAPRRASRSAACRGRSAPRRRSPACCTCSPRRPRWSGSRPRPAGWPAQPEPVSRSPPPRAGAGSRRVLDAGLVMSFFACAPRDVDGAGAGAVLAGPRRRRRRPRCGRTHRPLPHPARRVAVGAAGRVGGAGRACWPPGCRLGTALVALLTLATCGFLLAYVLVCAAAPVFLRRIGELTWPAVAVSAVLVPILLRRCWSCSSRARRCRRRSLARRCWRCRCRRLPRGCGCAAPAALAAHRRLRRDDRRRRAGRTGPVTGSLRSPAASRVPCAARWRCWRRSSPPARA